MNSMRKRIPENEDVLGFLFSADGTAVSEEAAVQEGKRTETAASAFAYDSENDRILVTLATLARLMNGDRALQEAFRRFASRYPAAKIVAEDSVTAAKAA